MAATISETSLANHMCYRLKWSQLDLLTHQLNTSPAENSPLPKAVPESVFGTPRDDNWGQLTRIVQGEIRQSCEIVPISTVLMLALRTLLRIFLCLIKEPA